MHEPWRIEMFGGLQVRLGGTVIDRFKTQKAAGVLAYLALFPKRTHTREELIDLFWPEVDIEKGRPSLSVALSSLRAQLEPPGVPAGSVIAADVTTVRLNQRAVVTDAAELEAHLSAAQSSQPSERIRH